jgi:hypothetical protein
MENILPAHEQELIRAFILKDKQERSAYLLSNPARRRKFTNGLAHFKWLDERFAHPIPATTAHTAVELVTLLRKKGAGPTVWVISEYGPIDGREMQLAEAMECTWGDAWELSYLVSRGSWPFLEARKCGVSDCLSDNWAEQTPGAF